MPAVPSPCRYAEEAREAALMGGPVGDVAFRSLSPWPTDLTADCAVTAPLAWSRVGGCWLAPWPATATGRGLRVLSRRRHPWSPGWCYHTGGAGCTKRPKKRPVHLVLCVWE